MTGSLSDLFAETLEARPDLMVGTAQGAVVSFEELVLRASGAAEVLGDQGIGSGSVLAVIGENSTEYLAFWTACQLAGHRVALINPSYPSELLTTMLEHLRPDAIASMEHSAVSAASDVQPIAYDGILRGTIMLDSVALDCDGDPPEVGHLPGAARTELDIAGYMHTSGTEGVPKFCAQSHGYFRRLARTVADSFCLGPDDRVLAPLPLFHVNPLGYGFLGAVHGLADFWTMPRFSASQFWPLVVERGITTLVLHGPPAEILKARAASEAPSEHRVRAAFFGDTEFLEVFDIPVGLSAYGSTEAGGITHLRVWRRGQRCEIPEGSSRVGGCARRDIEWCLADDGEILVRGSAPGTLFDGYVTAGPDLDPALDDDGWFHTGDVGRINGLGDLVFVERRAEAVQVRGEFVPLTYLDRRYRSIPGISDIAFWKRPGTNGDELACFAVFEEPDLESLARVSEALPRFMRPVWLGRVAQIPRDPGIGKVQRRRLSSVDVLEWWHLDAARVR